MASSPNSEPKPQPQLTQSSRLAKLRALAQHHLNEIEADKTEEQRQLTQAETEIQRYAKMGSFDRKKLHSSGSASSSAATIQPQLDQLAAAAANSVTGKEEEDSNSNKTKKDRFRPFSDILHRLQWDEKLNIDDYVVGYLERFEGIKEMPAKSWERDFSEEEWIPMHRVRYVKRVKSSDVTSGRQDHGPALGIVWDRDQRIDKIFGGGSRSEQSEDLVSIEGTSVTGGMAV